MRIFISVFLWCVGFGLLFAGYTRPSLTAANIALDRQVEQQMFEHQLDAAAKHDAKEQQEHYDKVFSGQHPLELGVTEMEQVEAKHAARLVASENEYADQRRGAEICGTIQYCSGWIIGALGFVVFLLPKYER